MLSDSWAEKAGLKNMKLDSYIISATSYEQLSLFYGNGSWSRDDFRNKHIIFPEAHTDSDYLRPILGIM
jgi:hypothetical protein